MSHQRFRPFKQTLTHDGEDIDLELCMAVKAGNRIWIRGQTGLDFDGAFIGAGDPAAQADNAMRCTQTLLQDAGATLTDIVKTTVYLTDRAHRTPVYAVLGQMAEGGAALPDGADRGRAGAGGNADGDRRRSRDRRRLSARAGRW